MGYSRFKEYIQDSLEPQWKNIELIKIYYVIQDFKGVIQDSVECTFKILLNIQDSIELIKNPS